MSKSFFFLLLLAAPLAAQVKVTPAPDRVAVEIDGKPFTTFFIGKVLFKDETWYHRWLHNETAFALQKRLEWVGKPMVILPARVS